MRAIESASTPLPEQIADAVPALICYVDQTRCYRFINRAYEDWFGVGRDAIVGRTTEQVLGPVAYPKIAPHVEAALAGKTCRFEVSVPYRDGASRLVEARYIPDYGPHGEVLGYYGLILDRSDAEAQRRIEELIDVFEDGFFALDFEWRVTYCNYAAAAYSGLQREDLLGRIFWDAAPKSADAPFAPVVHRAMAERTRVEVEFPSTIHPGGTVAVRIFPTDTGVGVSFRDITQAKAVAAQIKADRERVAALDRRHAFLLDFADALHELEDPAALLAEASARLGVFLSVGRCGYGEVGPDGDTMTVHGQWTDGKLTPLRTGRRLVGLGAEALATLNRGDALRLDDISADPRSSAAAGSFLANGVGAMLVAPQMRHGQLDAVIYLHHPTARAWTDADVSLVQDVAARTWNALARSRSERALRESEARFRALADSAPAPVWVTGISGAVEFVNQPFAELIGLPADQLLGDRWITLVHPQDLAAVAAAREEGRAGPHPYAFEARFRDASGGWRWMRAASKPRFNEAGVFEGYVGMAVDVTESRAAVDRQRLLINELNHRVKNTLATVQSLAHQTLRDGVVAREARDRFTERLLALSAAHNVLTRENWESAEIAEVVAEAIRPYDDLSRSRIAMTGPALRVSPAVALALSMALHELATNAVKYGALSTPHGTIGIAWQLGADAAELIWREAGGPEVTSPERPGFGSRLLRQGLAAELGAPAAVDYAPEGVVARLRVPVAP